MIKKLHFLQSKLFLMVLMVLISSVSLSHNTTIYAITPQLEKKAVLQSTIHEADRKEYSATIDGLPKILDSFAMNAMNTDSSTVCVLNAVDLKKMAFLVECGDNVLTKEVIATNCFLSGSRILYLVLARTSPPTINFESYCRFLCVGLKNFAKEGTSDILFIQRSYRLSVVEEIANCNKLYLLAYSSLSLKNRRTLLYKNSISSIT